MPTLTEGREAKTDAMSRPAGKTAPGTMAPSSGSTQAVVSKLKKRKRRRRIVLLIILLVVAGLTTVFIIKSNQEHPIVVQTEKVSRRTITEEVQATGKIQPEVSVKVSPEVPGEVVALPIKEGDKVKKQQVLAKIKPNTYRDQVAQAEASANSARGHEQQAKANQINAKQEFDRAKELHKKKLISEQDLQAAEAKYQVAVATHKSAQFDVKASESILRQYAEALNKTTVYSPMNGVVTSLITQLGEKVVGTSQYPGTEMMTISDLMVMNAEVDVDENDVVNVRLGDTAHVSIDAFPGRTFVGVVLEIANSAKLKGGGSQDQSTDFNVKIRIVNLDSADLRPGMSCTAKIQTKTKSNVLAIPINAVTRREDASAATSKKDSSKSGQSGATEEAPVVVFVVGKENRVKMVTVKTGISDNAYVEVQSGLSEQDEVVKGNYTAVSKDLADKKLVKIENTSGQKTSDATKSNVDKGAD